MKRYGGEGAESAMGFYDELFRLAAHGKYLVIKVNTSPVLLFIQFENDSQTFFKYWNLLCKV